MKLDHATREKRRFFNACSILMNIDAHELEDAGIIAKGSRGGNDWERFSRDPVYFIAKLDDAKRDALWNLIDRRQPRWLRIGQTTATQGETVNG